LTAFFNSKLFKYVFRDCFPELQGGTRELSKIFFEQIKVKPVSEAEEKKYFKLMEQIQKLKIEKKPTNILEVEIEKCLAEHYSLSDLEIEKVSSFSFV
jgi:adenine-specific DNA-methyltransferase